MTINPRITVNEKDGQLDLTFWGPSVTNDAVLSQINETINTAAEFMAAVNALKSPTGVIRIELSDMELVDVKVHQPTVPMVA